MNKSDVGFYRSKLQINAKVNFIKSNFYSHHFKFIALIAQCMFHSVQYTFGDNSLKCFVHLINCLFQRRHILHVEDFEKNENV